MLRASLSNPKDDQIKEAAKDFEPYLARFSARIRQPEEVSAWEATVIPENDRGLELVGSGWAEKRRTDMKRHNPKFVLRQWVLEELIGKLEESGVERIEDGRKDLAKVLDVSRTAVTPHLLPFMSLAKVGCTLTWPRCQLDHSSIGIKLGPRRSDCAD